MKKKQGIAKDIIDGLQGFVDVLKKDEVVSEKFTSRRVVLDLHPLTYDPKAVQNTRQLLQASQVIFAQFLGVSPKTVRAWEQGATVPSDMACRFLDEIRRDPAYWRNRLRQSIVVKETCKS